MGGWIDVDPIDAVRHDLLNETINVAIAYSMYTFTTFLLLQIIVQNCYFFILFFFSF